VSRGERERGRKEPVHNGSILEKFLGKKYCFSMFPKPQTIAAT
jgi:hypothetical protein